LLVLIQSLAYFLCRILGVRGVLWVTVEIQHAKHL